MKAVILAIFFPIFLFASTIKDVANIVGVRDNELIGYGLVVGLNGSGDGSSSEFTIQSISNMLGSMNIKINPNDIKSKNTAAVMINATLPAFAKAGDKIDVNVASLGDAKSLKGGTLLLSPLKGVDGNIYALAQGNLSIEGKNSNLTSAVILQGASVEREVEFDFENAQKFTLSLKNADFMLANKIMQKINSFYDIDIARAQDSKSVIIERPEEMNAVEFLAQVQAIDIGKAPKKSIVVINEKTGTIVSGVDVEVAPVLISQGAITIKVEPKSPYESSQNEIDMKDGTLIDPTTQKFRIKSEKITLANIARALNKLGVTPAELIDIIKNLKIAGAIDAEVKII